MNRTSILFLFLLSFAIDANAQADESIAIKYRNLDSLKAVDNHGAYFDSLASIASYYRKKLGPNNTARFESTLKTFNKYGRYRSPSNSIERSSLRKYYSSKLYSMRCLSGLNQSWLDTALVAHQLIQNQTELDGQAWHIENWIGHYYATKDDYDKALQFYLLVQSHLKQSKNTNRLSRNYASIADLQQWSGRYGNALSTAAEGLKLAREKNDTLAMVASMARISEISLELKDFESHLHNHNLLMALLKSNYKDHFKNERFFKVFENHAQYYFLQEKYDSALEQLKLASKNIKHLKQYNNRRTLAKLKLQEGEIFFQQKKYNDALSCIKKGYQLLIPNFNPIDEHPNSNQILPENTLVELLALHAQIIKSRSKHQKKMDEIIKAGRLLSFALKANESLRERMVLSNSKSNSTETNRNLINAAIDNQWLLYDIDSSKFKFAPLIDLFEQSKNLLLNEYIRLNHSIANISGNRRKELDALQVDITTDLKSETNNRDSLQNSIHSKKERIYKLLNFDPKVQNQTFKSDNPFLEYFVSAKNIYLLTFTNDQYQFYNLGPKDFLFPLMKKLAEKMLADNKSIKETQIILDRLSKLLLPDSLILPTEFSVVLDGELSNLPFEILRKDKTYLLEYHSIEMRFSHRTDRNRTRNEKLRVFCVAPNYSGNDSISKDRSSPYPLPFAKEEIELVSKHFDSFQLEDTMNVKNIKSSLNDFNCFHFSGHAKATGHQAFLYLCDENGLVKWSYQEIQSIQRNLKLVTLSACETGLGELKPGDGMQSLARSFLASGTETVVYSLWNANDHSTKELMNLFYTNLFDGLNVAEALRLAKMAFIEKADQAISHPYYWASFTASGNLEPLVRKSQSTPSNKILISLLLIILALGLTIKATTKKTS